jgi:hypothetical protein
LDNKISELQRKVDGLPYILYIPHLDKTWETIMDLMKEIQDDFKTVRYPTRQNREEAWQQFFELRQKIYTKKNKRFEYISKNHKDELHRMLGGLEYWALREELRQMVFTELSAIKAEVIRAIYLVESFSKNMLTNKSLSAVVSAFK